MDEMGQAREAAILRRLWTWALAWGPAIAVMSIIYRLSSQPDFGRPGWASAFARRLLGEGPLLAHIAWTLPYLDAYLSWVAHFVEFGLLATALLWGIRRTWPAARRSYLMAWLATVTYGLLDEWHQSFVPNRHPDPRDVLTDALGAAFALGMVWIFDQRRAKIKDR